MTQYLATCTNCGGKVSHLEPVGEVATCDACQAEPNPKPKKEKP